MVRRLAHHVKRRLGYHPGIEIEDLEQAGMAGLIEAAPRFNGAGGAGFETFIGHRVRGAMLDSLREGDWTPRSVHRAAREIAVTIRAIEIVEQRPARESEIAERMGLSLASYRQILADTTCQHVFSSAEHEEQIHDATDGLTQSPPPPDKALEMEGFHDALHQAMAALPERERIIIEKTYFNDMTLLEVGAELGITESRVCQLRTQAIARLRAKLLV